MCSLTFHDRTKKGPDLATGIHFTFRMLLCPVVAIPYAVVLVKRSLKLFRFGFFAS